MLLVCLFLFQGIPGFRPRTPRPFCFGKRPQNHIGRGMAPRLRGGKLFGYPARFTDTGGAQTRCAQTVLAFFPVAVPLLGYATRPGEPRGEGWPNSQGSDKVRH